jgi:hypothetical protein
LVITEESDAALSNCWGRGVAAALCIRVWRC